MLVAKMAQFTPKCAPNCWNSGLCSDGGLCSVLSLAVPDLRVALHDFVSC